MSKTNTMEPEPDEIWNAWQEWQEWEDGDDSALYDSGYRDGIIKAIDILNSVREQEQVDRLPSSFTVSVVVATLREILKGN
jgi:hypothetical protein